MTIFIPTPLRPYAGGKDSVEVNAATIAEALELAHRASTPSCASISSRPRAKLRAFVNLYLNDEDVRYLSSKEATAVTAADTLSIIPSIAGGGLAVQAWSPSAQAQPRRSSKCVT